MEDSCVYKNIIFRYKSYFVVYDGKHNWTLYVNKEHNKKKDVEVTAVVGYYPKFEMAVQKIFRESVAERMLEEERELGKLYRVFCEVKDALVYEIQKMPIESWEKEFQENRSMIKEIQKSKKK
jgi:hypothetical protein